MYDLDNVSLGLWVDLPKRTVLSPYFFHWVAEVLRFDLVSIMIDNADPEVEFLWTAKDIERAWKLADRYALEIGLTTWPYPNKQLLKKMMEKMDELLKAGGVNEWETDQEFNWRASNVRGFADLDLAGDCFVAEKHAICQKHEVRNTLTTFTYHTENSIRAGTAPHMDRLVVQAYAVDERDGRDISWDNRLGPGNMQKLTIDRTLEVPGVKDGKPELGVGHAAWNQDHFRQRDGSGWRIVPPQEAMQVSFEAALAYSPVAHNWWSAKFTYPESPRFNSYAEAFLKTLRND